MQSEQKRNYTIDILRFVMALFIVALHTNPLVEFSPFISYFPSQVLSRLGVPFFSVVAGYYFFRKEVKKEHVWQTIKKYLSLYTIWSTVMITYQLLNTKSGGVLQSLGYIVKTYFLTGFYQLWYMLAIIYTLILVWVLSKVRHGIKILLAFSFVFLLTGILMFGYGNWFMQYQWFEHTLGSLNYNINMETQWLTIVIPFFMLGYVLRKKDIPSIICKRCEILLGMAVVAYFAEVIIIQVMNLKNSTTLCLFTCPVITLLLICAIKHPSVCSAKVAHYASGLASFIYFSHILVVLILQRIGLSETPTYVITIGLTVLLGCLILKSSNKTLMRLVY